MNIITTSALADDSLAVPEAGIFPSSSNPESMTNDELASIAVAAFSRIQDSMPYIIELRKRFQSAPRGKANIAGCDTWGEFCERHLYRTPSAVRKAIAVVQSPQPLTPLPCAVCLAELQSKKQWGRHIRTEHPEQADAILGKQQFPTSSDTQGAKIIDISDKGVVIQTGKTEHSIKRLPLTVDTDTIRSSTKTNHGELKPIEYKPNSCHIKVAPEQPSPKSTFYVIRRNEDGEFLSTEYFSGGSFKFSYADELSLERVFRFSEPFEYSCLYYVPDGKRKERELDRSEWQWVKVSISMEAV